MFLEGRDILFKIFISNFEGIQIIKIAYIVRYVSSDFFDAGTGYQLQGPGAGLVIPNQTQHRWPDGFLAVQRNGINRFFYCISVFRKALFGEDHNDILIR